MRSKELTQAILEQLRQGKKQNEIAKDLGVHHNTVYRHVKLLREQQINNEHLTLNKIDNRLNKDINTMSHTALLSWRSQLVPKRIETKGELTVKKEIPSIDIHKFNSEELSEIRRVARSIHASRDAGEK